MTPPVASVASDSAGPAERPPAVFARVATLTERADFVRASRALREAGQGFHLQARKRDDEEPGTGIRVGFTCSKKVGNAVARNRAKRRLREAARIVLPAHGRAGWDYVIVGKRDATASVAFDALTSDLARAVQRVHRGAR